MKTTLDGVNVAEPTSEELTTLQPTSQNVADDNERSAPARASTTNFLEMIQEIEKDETLISKVKFCLQNWIGTRLEHFIDQRGSSQQFSF